MRKCVFMLKKERKREYLSLVGSNPFSRILMYSLSLIFLSHEIDSTPEDENVPTQLFHHYHANLF